MTNMNELVGMIGEINALVDDMNFEGKFKVISVYVSTNCGKTRVLLNAESFFNYFTGFKITDLETPESRFEVSKVVQGIEFIARVDDFKHFKNAKYALKKGHEKSLRAVACE